MKLAHGAGQDRNSVASGGYEVDGFHEGGGVCPGAMRKSRDDPGVAALFLGLAQFVAGPPGDGVPPIEKGDEKLEEADEVVAAAIVGELVEEESLALAVVEAMPKGLGDEEFCTAGE